MMKFDQLFCQGKAYSCSFLVFGVGFISLVETVEDVGELVGRYPRTSI